MMAPADVILTWTAWPITEHRCLHHRARRRACQLVANMLQDRGGEGGGVGGRGVGGSSRKPARRDDPDQSVRRASIASREVPYIGQTMSSEVIRRSSLARSETPASTISPPFVCTSFQQRSRRAR